MNLNFEEVENKKVVKSEGIFIAGEHVGKVEEKDYFGGRSFYACIDIAGFPGSLVQGHGDTREEAVLNAISKSRQEAIDRLAALEDLQESLVQKEAI